MESLSDVFGRRVKFLRKQKALTQEALGRLAKVDYKYLGALERGERTPSFDAIERIAKALKVDFYELFLADEHTSRLEKALSAVVRNVDRLDRSKVQTFFHELHAAIKRLDGQNS